MHPGEMEDPPPDWAAGGMLLAPAKSQPHRSREGLSDCSFDEVRHLHLNVVSHFVLNSQPGRGPKPTHR